MAPLFAQQQTQPYVLITAAYNEEAYIERTIASVVRQTTLPSKWLIVSDGSVDRTDDIVRKYLARYPFIELLHLDETHTRSFASKAFALNAGARRLQTEKYSFIGHLDADISLEPTYFSDLLEKFQLDPRLGIAGGFIYEESDGEFKPRPINTTVSVAGALQLFRRECREAVGEFLPLKCGGEDWHAEIQARMNGWRVLAFPELKAYHHRPTGASGGILRSCYRLGKMDYAFGSHPLFEIVKVVRRLGKRPYLVGSALRLLAFTTAYCSREATMVSPEVVRFLRKEQMDRLRVLKWVPKTIV